MIHAVSVDRRLTSAGRRLDLFLSVICAHYFHDKIPRRCKTMADYRLQVDIGLS